MGSDAPQSHGPEHRLAQWLDRIRTQRDFGERIPASLVGDGGLPIVAAVRSLIASCAKELARFGFVVADADEAIARNGRQLHQARITAQRYQELVTTASELLLEMEAASQRAADHTRELESDARLAEEASRTASRHLHDEDGARARTISLAEVIEQVVRSSQALSATSGGLLEFVGGVQRISRQAALLSTNARIEAAHLGEAGKGFDIVAGEVRTLSESTKQAVLDVGVIARQLAEATQRAAVSTAHAFSASKELASAQGEIATNVDAIEAAAREFVEPVGAIAAVAEEQQRALPELAEQIHTVTKLADALANAADEAAELDLASIFGRVRQMVDAYRLDAASVAEPPPGDPRVDAIVAVARGETHAAAGFDDELSRAVDAFAADVAQAQREILSGIVQAAVAVARNSYLWRAIGARIADLRSAVDRCCKSFADSRQAAAALVDASSSMKAVAEELQAQTGSAARTLGDSVQSLDRVRENVALVATVVSEMSAALDHAGTILSLVDEISAETNLLALNAAIEAAHAGDAGLGFSVIAGEIRKLSDNTHVATSHVARTIADIATAGETIRDGTAESIDLAQAVEQRARSAEGAVRELVVRMGQAVDRSLELAGIAQQEMRAYDGLIRELDVALQTIDANTAAATDVRRLELAEVGMRAFAISSSRELGIFSEKMRTMGFQLAQEMDDVFDTAIERGEITIEDCRDTDYHAVDGSRIAELGRLFDVSRVPASGFDPPKFSTRYDRGVEAGIDAIIDAYVPTDPAIKAMFAVDLNGYCFGHYRECRQAWTGDYATDLTNNRIKRFFDDALSLRCSRVGLGGRANALPARTPYATFESSGCELRRPRGARPWAIYTYARDTGLVYNDLSLALFVRDHRVGTIRIIYDPDVV